MTDDEETEDNGDKIDNDLLNDVCETIQLQTNILPRDEGNINSDKSEKEERWTPREGSEK